MDVGFETGVDIILDQPLEFARGERMKVKNTVDGNGYRIHGGFALLRGLRRIDVGLDIEYKHNPNRPG
jgi:hypothetical protein